VFHLTPCFVRSFPRAVAEHTRAGAVSTAYLNDLRSWLRADVDPDRPQDSVPRLLDGISQQARTIDAKFGRGILATKSVLDTTGGIWAVPAPLLALLLQ
jgi:hypothetical protein